MMRLEVLFRIASLLAPSASACLSHAESAHEAVSPLRRRTLTTVGRTAISNVSVFNGYKMTPPQTVMIEGEHIGSFDARGADIIIDGTGHYLIPGLIDSHLHLNEPSDLETLTSYGVTTAFQMACRNYTRCAMFRGHPDLCDFFTAGVPAVGPGSHHASQFGLGADQIFFPNTSAVEAVNYAFGNGSDYFKITVETNGPSPSSQADLVRAAHAMGRQTMSHCADLRSYLQVIDSGSDGLQHVPQDGLLTSNGIEQMLSQHQHATPTMTVFEYGLSDPQRAAQLGANGSYDYVRANVALLHSFGVPILAGTDAVGVLNQPSGTVSLPHGSTLHRELQLLVDTGLSEAEALRAATIVPSTWHRVFDRGSIEPGKRADLLMLKSNPLVNITNTLDIAKVWVKGREFADVVARTTEA